MSNLPTYRVGVIAVVVHVTVLALAAIIVGQLQNYPGVGPEKFERLLCSACICGGGGGGGVSPGTHPWGGQSAQVPTHGLLQTHRCGSMEGGVVLGVRDTIQNVKRCIF